MQMQEQQTTRIYFEDLPGVLERYVGLITWVELQPHGLPDEFVWQEHVMEIQHDEDIVTVVGDGDAKIQFSRRAFKGVVIDGSGVEISTSHAHFLVTTS